ncbi:MAG: glycosyltransferase family 39 protein [Ignavibacteria bacterium]|nr:glycosyltransferase family 39 protein [Ignavibacteria bacterium]
MNDNRIDKIIIVFSFFLVFLIRLINIEQKNLWFDEIFSWNIATDNLSSLINRTSLDIHPPLYYLSLKLWIYIAGDSVLSMRILSTLFSSLSVIFIYLLSVKIMGRIWTVFVILLYAFSPLNIFYSQEVRMASLNLFLNLGSVYFFYQLISNSGKFPFVNKTIPIIYIFFRTAALYTHYFSFLILTGEILYLAINYRMLFLKNKRMWLLIYTVIFILYLPWIPALVRQLVTGQEWRSSQDVSSLITEYVNYMKDLNLGLYYHYWDPEVIQYISALILILFMISLMFGFRKPMNKALLSFIFLITVVVMILSGLIYIQQKIEFYRYLSILVPYFLIIFVFGYSVMKINFRYVFPALLLVINIFGMKIYFSFDFKNNDYRALVNDIQREYQSGDRIYTEPHYYAWIADYYFSHNGSGIKTVNIKYGFKELMDSLNIQNPDRAWFILDYSVSDTTSYMEYKRKISEKYVFQLNKTYNLAPSKAELFLLKRKVKTSVSP